jgi:hypothetical protein
MPRTADRAPVRPVLVDERIASHDFSGFEVGDLAKIQLRSDVFAGKDVASNQSQRLTTVRTVDQLLSATIVGVLRRLSVSALRRVVLDAAAAAAGAAASELDTAASGGDGRARKRDCD